MRSRLLATLVVAVALVAGCASESSDSIGDDVEVDPAFAQMVENLADGDTTTTYAPIDVSAYEGINRPCLVDRLIARMGTGEFTAEDMQLWMMGADPEGPVTKAALEIGDSGVCDF